MTVGMAMLPFAMSAVALSFESVPALTCAGVGSAAVFSSTTQYTVPGSFSCTSSTASLPLIALTFGKLDLKNGGTESVVRPVLLTGTRVNSA